MLLDNRRGNRDSELRVHLGHGTDGNEMQVQSYQWQLAPKQEEEKSSQASLYI